MKLAEKLQAPIVNTLLGKGACPEDHPLHLGMLGMHGTAYANKAVIELRPDHGDRRALGRPHHRQAVASSAWTRPRSTSTSTPPSSTRSSGPTSSMAGDARLAIEDLLPLVDKLRHRRLAGARSPAGASSSRSSTPSRAACARSTCSIGWTSSAGATASSPPTSASTRCGRRSSAARPRTATGCRSGGAGTMGFGFPAAIGAQFAQPGQEGLVRSSATAASR